jgi:hypothetical protein
MTPHLSLGSLGRFVWIGRAVRFAFEDPVEGLDRALLRVLGRWQERPALESPDEAWEQHLHALIGEPWPCPARADFEGIFSDAREMLRGRGLAFGRGAFGGWDDADRAFARAVWCLSLHLRPDKVVETGVGRGITTRLILEALRRTRSGHLWSIDRPPLDRRLHAELGAAVPPDLRGRWTLLSGTSRRVLPGLLHRLAPIDLFVHDSLHTERNVRFELTRARGAISADGALVIDDVERNRAFRRFVDENLDLDALVAPAEDGRNFFGVLVAAGRVI